MKSTLISIPCILVGVSEALVVPSTTSKTTISIHNSHTDISGRMNIHPIRKNHPRLSSLFMTNNNNNHPNNNKSSIEQTQYHKNIQNRKNFLHQTLLSTAIATLTLTTHMPLRPLESLQLIRPIRYYYAS